MSPHLTPEERKKRVLNSHAFETWEAARSSEEPVPTNMYQAYMIDLSLHAKVNTRSKWENEPNRNDLIDIDFPSGGVPTWAPARKPPRRREAPYKSPEIPKSGISRDVFLAVERMTLRHGVPTPNVVPIHNEGVNRSYANTGIIHIGGRLAGYGKPSAHIGVAGSGGKTRVVHISTALHEAGHIIHAQNLLGVGAKLPEGIAKFTGSPKNYADEQAATRLARAEMRKTLPTKGGALGVGMWDLAYGLHTYRRGWEGRGNPVRIDKKTQNILSGGSF